MKSLTGRIPSARGWALLLTMFLGAGLMIAACGDEETPAPTVPTPTPPPTPPPPPPEPEPEPEPPAVPTGLQVSGTGLDFIEWSWTAVEGADGYEVQFSADEEFTDDDETTVVAEGTSHRVGNLAPGTTGFLRVRAFTGEGDSRLLSGWSSHRTGTSAVPPPPMPPAAPTGLMVSDTGEDFIEWSWTAVEGADGYLVQFSTDEDFTDYREAPVAEGTSYRVRNLAPGTTGYLRVRAFTGEGDSRLLGDWSLHRTGTSALPPAPMPPATPTGLTFSSEAGADFIEWSWTPVEGADGYQVQFSTNEDFTDHREALVTEGTSHRVGDLAPGTTGYLRVRAFADEGDSRLFSDWSATGTGMTSATPPAAPTGLMISDIGEDFLVWSWTAVAGADGYIVQFSTDEDFTGDEETLVARGTSHRVGGLDPGTTGYLRVLAFTGEGASRLRSPWSLHRTGMTTPAPLEAPAVPTGLMVSDTGEDFIEWKWRPIQGVGGYEVQFSANEAFTDQDEVINRTAEQITYRRTGLDAEATAYLRVRAYVGEGDARVRSAWSTHVTGTTTAPEPELPATPANLRVVNTGSDFIVWTWNRVAGASGYEVQFSRQAVITDNDQKSVVTGIASTTHRVANLPSSTNGYLRVRAWSGTSTAPVNGAWSVPVRGTTKAPPPAVPLSRPENVRSTGQDEDSITLAWNEVEDADQYLVRQRLATATAWSNASCGGSDHIVEDNSCVASGLDEGVAYDFQVRAVPDSSDLTRFEASPWSAEIEATTVGETRPTSSGGSGALNVRWSSDANNKVDFIWDRISGAKYETFILDKYNISSTPCSPTALASQTALAWVDQTLKTTQAVSAPAATGFTLGSTIRGLCVRTEDRKNVSFAWGVSRPTAPRQDSHDELNGRTTAIRWQGLTQVKDFPWTTRVAARATNSDGSDGVSLTADDIQKACDEGTFVRQETDPDVSLLVDTSQMGGFKERVNRGLRPNTAYMICQKFANAAGETEWATGDAIVTVPAAPPVPRATLSATSTGMLVTWTSAVKGRADVPRHSDQYRARVIQVEEGDTTPRVANCGPNAEYADYGGVTATPWMSATTSNISVIGEGIEIISGVVVVPTSGAADKWAYLCLQAFVGTHGSDPPVDRVGPWIISPGKEVK